MLELRHLRSFCVVAEERHVTRAAKRLNIAQPALTQQMKSLEADLGVTLFCRAGRGIEITEAGRTLQKEAEGILEHVRVVGAEVRRVEGKGLRRVSVAVSDVECMSNLVTDLLARYRQAHPHITLREQVLEPAEVGAALRDHRVDAALFCATVPDMHDMSCYRLGSSPVLLAVPRQHAMAARSGIGLEALANEPLILVTHGDSPGSFEGKLRAACAERGFRPHVREETVNVLLALNLTASNAGIAIVPESMQGMRTDAISYVPLLGSPDLRVEFMLYIRRQERARDILALKDLISNVRPQEATAPPA